MSPPLGAPPSHQHQRTVDVLPDDSGDGGETLGGGRSGFHAASMARAPRRGDLRAPSLRRRSRRADLANPSDRETPADADAS